MKTHLWVVNMLQELIEYSLLNGLKETATAMLVVREIADDEICLGPNLQPSNIITFPSVQTLLVAIDAAHAGDAVHTEGHISH